MDSPETKNQVSAFQASFINAFIGNSDYFFGGHNVNILFDMKGTPYFSPYDFDLANVTSDSAFLPDTHNQYLESVLSRAKAGPAASAVQPTIRRILAARPAIRKLFQDSQLDDQSKKFMLDWFSKSADVLAGNKSAAPAEESP